MNLKYSPTTGHPYVRFDMTAEKYREWYPVESWAWNPWTGQKRDERDATSVT